MLKITIPGQEFWDDEAQQFTYDKDVVLTLEHSLVSLSKWESKYHKPFLGKENQTNEEIIDYIRFMTLTQNVDPKVYDRIDNRIIKEIATYIQDPMTATWFSNARKPTGNSRRVTTAEIIYYQMIAFNIPFECQKWHLNRLLTLIRVCDEESQPKKKMSARESAMQQAEINKARRRAKAKGGKP